MSKRSKRDKDDDSDKPISLRADKLADWLDDIRKAPALIRAFKVRWYRSTIFDLALEALDELADLEKKNGVHDRIRRSLNTMVMAMGGAELKWQAATKKDD